MEENSKSICVFCDTKPGDNNKRILLGDGKASDEERKLLEDIEDLQFAMDPNWQWITACMIFFMQAGFAGLTLGPQIVSFIFQILLLTSGKLAPVSSSSTISSTCSLNSSSVFLLG